MNRRVVMAFEAGALVAALLLCAADRFATQEPRFSIKNPQRDLQQLFLFLKEETLVLGESFPQEVHRTLFDRQVGSTSNDQARP